MRRGADRTLAEIHGLSPYGGKPKVQKRRWWAPFRVLNDDEQRRPKWVEPPRENA